MKVKQVRLYLVPSERCQINIVEIRTDDGFSGLGEVGMSFGNRGALAVAAELGRTFLLDQDPRQVERHWDRMYRETFWGRGGGGHIIAAMSALEEACCDILGKSLGAPAYMFLGGKVNDRIRLYVNGWYPVGGSLADHARAAERVVRDGYLALKFDPFCFSSAEQGRVPTKSLQRDAIGLAAARVAAVRDAVGPDVDIMLEAHGWFDVRTAIEVGQRMEEYKCAFYEEPIETTNPQSMAEVAASVRIPVAAGERLYTRWGFLPYLQANAFRIAQPDVGNTGGMHETKRIAALADTFHIPIAPHNCWGPIATAATVNVDASTPNLLVQEWFPYQSDLHYRVVDEAYEHHASHGYLVISDDRPGLGVNLNEAVVAPYLVDVVES